MSASGFATWSEPRSTGPLSPESITMRSMPPCRSVWMTCPAPARVGKELVPKRLAKAIAYNEALCARTP